MTALHQVRRLAIDTYVSEGRGATRIEIDGVDLLDVQRPARRPDGSVYPDGPMTFLPPDPLGLLPPDSSALLPAAAPRHAMVGICSCGEAGCSSLWLQLRREGSQVIWEPDPNSPRSSIDIAWTCELRQYLDAVDDGQRSTLRWETRARLLARELRRQREGLFGFPMIDLVARTELTLLNVLAWPGRDDIILQIATNDGVRELTVHVDDDRTDEQILNSVRGIDPARFT